MRLVYHLCCARKCPSFKRSLRGRLICKKRTWKWQWLCLPWPLNRANQIYVNSLWQAKSVCLSIYILICLSVCLLDCLSAICQFVRPSLNPYVCLPVCLLICVSVYLSACLSGSLFVCLFACLPACLPIFLHLYTPFLSKHLLLLCTSLARIQYSMS